MNKDELINLITKRAEKQKDLNRLEISERDACSIAASFKRKSEIKGDGRYSFSTIKKHFFNDVKIRVDDTFDHYGNYNSVEYKMDSFSVEYAFVNDTGLFDRFMTQYLSCIRNKIQSLKNECDSLTEKIKQNL